MHVGGYVEAIEVVIASLVHRFFQSAKAVGLNMAAQVDRGHVGELDVECALGCPSTVVAVVLQSQFVGPNFHTLHVARIVAHTNHDGSHLAERRITHHADTIGGLLRVILGIDL